MACLCHSVKSHFKAEVCIHFPGFENLDRPPVFVFPMLSVCLVCGSTEFVIGESELQELRSPDAQGNSRKQPDRTTE